MRSLRKEEEQISVGVDAPPAPEDHTLSERKNSSSNQLLEGANSSQVPPQEPNFTDMAQMMPVSSGIAD